MRSPTLVVLVAVTAAACSSEAPAPPRTAVTPSTSATTGPEKSDGRAFDPDRVDIDLEPAASGFEAPLLIENAGDGSDRLFVGEQGGRVWVVDDGVVSGEPWLDIATRISAGGERGLLGLAFHPDFEDNGRFFVNYTDVNGDTVVAEYRTDADARVVDTASERVLLHIDQPYANHNGGNLEFGPDGYLYIGTGDGGGAGDPEENGQDLTTLLGKLLRLDVDSSSAGHPYAIPEDNPFADDPDARPEIWAFGLRNPWRFSFDSASDAIWIGDVGQSEIEEIDTAPADKGGINYGWNVMEGDSCYAESDCDPIGLLPVTEYGHDGGCSVTGGFVYEGGQNPDMNGGYYFSDYCSGSIWAIPSTATEPRSPSLLTESDRSISTFGLDESGELYAADISSGDILHLVDRKGHG